MQSLPAMPANPPPRIEDVQEIEGRMTWAERTTDALALAGYRRGGARQAIVELLEEQPCALSAAEIEVSAAEVAVAACRAPACTA